MQALFVNRRSVCGSLQLFMSLVRTGGALNLIGRGFSVFRLLDVTMDQDFKQFHGSNSLIREVGHTK